MSRFVFSMILAGAVATVASACGGEGDKTAREIRAEQVLTMAPDGWNDFVEVERVSEWHHAGEVLTAWARVKLENKPAFVDCEAVDTAQRIDNDDDISLALQNVPDSYCQGEKPDP